MCYAHLSFTFLSIELLEKTYFPFVHIISVLGRLDISNRYRIMSTLLRARSFVHLLNYIPFCIMVQYTLYYLGTLLVIILWTFLSPKESDRYDHCWLEFLRLFCPRKNRIVTASKLVIVF